MHGATFLVVAGFLFGNASVTAAIPRVMIKILPLLGMELSGQV